MKSIHGILKHKNSVCVLEQHHSTDNGILKSDSLSSGDQNAIRSSLRGQGVADGSANMADVTLVDVSKVDVVARQHSGSDSAAEFDETRLEVIPERTESFGVKDGADDNAFEKVFHEDVLDEEIHEDERKMASTEDVEQNK